MHFRGEKERKSPRNFRIETDTLFDLVFSPNLNAKICIGDLCNRNGKFVLRQFSERKHHQNGVTETKTPHKRSFRRYSGNQSTK